MSKNRNNNARVIESAAIEPVDGLDAEIQSGIVINDITDDNGDITPESYDEGRYVREFRQITVKEFFATYYRRMDFSPSYQRRVDAWGDDRRQRFYDTIVKNRPSSVLTWLEVAELFQSVDGNQRVEAIAGLVQGRYLYNGLMYGQLEPRIRSYFEKYLLNVEIVSGIEDMGEASEMFSCLNGGLKIAAALVNKGKMIRELNQINVARLALINKDSSEIVALHALAIIRGAKSLKSKDLPMNVIGASIDDIAKINAAIEAVVEEFGTDRSKDDGLIKRIIKSTHLSTLIAFMPVSKVAQIGYFANVYRFFKAQREERHLVKGRTAYDDAVRSKSSDGAHYTIRLNTFQGFVPLTKVEVEEIEKSETELAALKLAEIEHNKAVDEIMQAELAALKLAEIEAIKGSIIDEPLNALEIARAARVAESKNPMNR